MTYPQSRDVVRKAGIRGSYGMAWPLDLPERFESLVNALDSMIRDDCAPQIANVLRATLFADLGVECCMLDLSVLLACHELVRPITEASLEDTDVVRRNRVLRTVHGILDLLHEKGMRVSLPSDLSGEYERAIDRIHVASPGKERTDLMRRLYEGFMRAVSPGISDSMGVVYTPVEIVDAQLHMIRRVLERDFDTTFSDPRVNVMDGFAGTGIHFCRLVEDPTLITDEGLEDRYLHGLRANEIIPFSASLAAAGIEAAYQRRTGTYAPFSGCRAADTLDDVSPQREDDGMIRVIVGNPPYGTGFAGTHPRLERRAMATYEPPANGARNGFLAALRWASDHIGSQGVICFVTTARWIKEPSYTRMRARLADEFDDIYVLDLRGDQEYHRGDRQHLAEEGSNVFGHRTRSPIAIVLLTRNPQHHGPARVHYRDCGSRLTVRGKKRFLERVAEQDPEWAETSWSS